MLKHIRAVLYNPINYCRLTLSQTLSKHASLTQTCCTLTGTILLVKHDPGLRICRGRNQSEYLLQYICNGVMNY